MKLYTATEFAKLIGVSKRTLHRWERQGRLTAYRNDSGRRFYTRGQYLQYVRTLLRNSQAQQSKEIDFTEAFFSSGVFVKKFWQNLQTDL